MTPEQVIANYWIDGKLPINPAIIASNLGINVKGAELSNSNKKNPTSVTYNPNNSHPVILYNKEESKIRNNFAIAHALGHYFQNPNHGISCTSDAFTIFNPDAQERKANQFALELLIPEIYLKVLIFQEGVTDFTKLTKLFQVAPQALEYRIKQLGII